MLPCHASQCSFDGEDDVIDFKVETFDNLPNPSSGAMSMRLFHPNIYELGWAQVYPVSCSPNIEVGIELLANRKACGADLSTTRVTVKLQ
jgi:hypothetical protein